MEKDAHRQSAFLFRRQKHRRTAAGHRRDEP